LFFVGRNFENHVPLANGKVLVWLQQYDGCRPVDRLTQVFYPNYDLTSQVLAEGGGTVLVKLSHERIWYDPYGLIRENPGQAGEIVSIDDAGFVGGNGIYQVASHKGDAVVRTRTWAPPGCNAVVRSIEVSTLRGGPSEATIYPVVNTLNVAGKAANTVLSRINHEAWLAVTCKEAASVFTGNVASSINGMNQATFEHGSVPTQVTFSAVRAVPAGGWSRPLYLVLAFGTSRIGAEREIKKVLASTDCLYSDTAAWWDQWHAAGTRLVTSDARLNYLWRTSLTLLRNCLQEDNLPILIGFRPYQGNVWIRDSIWIIATLARAGHPAEAAGALHALKKILRKRKDGNFYFAYNCVTKMPHEHSYENDSTGLILYGIWSCYRALGEAGIIREYLSLIEHCADWICSNLTGSSGLVKSCAGISEVFGPHLGQRCEQMVWTSAVSAYGLEKAAAMLEVLGADGEKVRKYRRRGLELQEAVLTHGVKDGVLCRSRESSRLDTSVLNFLFGDLMTISDPQLLENTVKACTERLVDPILGGVWRYEESITEEGDLRPWLFYTFLMGEAHLALGQKADAWRYFTTALGYSTYCGLFPELMYTRDMPRGIGMASFSQCGFIRAMLAHMDPGERTVSVPEHLAFMKFENVLADGGRFDVSG
jgi:hypothetical protein